MSANYHLWLNEAAKGPFTIGQLRAMWNSGQITTETHYTVDAGESWPLLSDLINDLEPKRALVVKRDYKVQCPHCGKKEIVNIGTGPYECEHCGKDFEITLACPKCGEDIEVNRWGEEKCPACKTSFNSWGEAKVASNDKKPPLFIPQIQIPVNQSPKRSGIKVFFYILFSILLVGAIGFISLVVLASRAEQARQDTLAQLNSNLEEHIDQMNQAAIENHMVRRGMTKEDVLRSLGQPYNTIDASGRSPNLKDIWQYNGDKSVSFDWNDQVIISSDNIDFDQSEQGKAMHTDNSWMTNGVTSQN